jgi:tetrahydromethanopterin S-methyltransferase subunit G
MEWLIPIVVAIIGGPLVVIMQKFRKENKEDHAVVKSLLDKIDGKVDKVDAKVDQHIQWHLGRKKKVTK